jgi:hypothetical protein
VEKFKIILSILTTPFLMCVMILTMQAGLYKNVICFSDVYRVPNRFIRKFTMNEEERAEITIKEYQKLRNLLEALDIPLRDKQSIVWGIERAEKDAVLPLSKSIQEETLKRIKEQI